MTLTSSAAIRIRHLWRRLGDLGPYAGHQFALELVAKSSAALDMLERYGRLDPAITNAFGVEPPSLWASSEGGANAIRKQN